jgi:hypothetical protein
MTTTSALDKNQTGRAGMACSATPWFRTGENERGHNETVGRQMILAATIGERFLCGLPLEPMGPPGSFSAELAYQAVSAVNAWPALVAVKYGLAHALLRIEDLDERGWLIGAPGHDAVGFVVEPPCSNWLKTLSGPEPAETVAEMVAEAKFGKIGLHAHVLPGSASTWSFDGKGRVVIILVADRELFAEWTRARLNDSAKMRALIRAAANSREA